MLWDDDDILLGMVAQVRKTTSNKLYEAVLTYDEVAPPESLEEILSLLSETKWFVLSTASLRSCVFVCDMCLHFCVCFSSLILCLS